ncbi:hypothetical protein HPB49_002134 [Dermacentor silvarum]|uniref:Uncharacterized protein n=1 Tax=Dermacentor silvarum TaxID=543639 RepID=A0ACB8DTR6_DERSI|nr:hypothetical protein HPB49_002134 [Dermacentor silvarum]
MDFADIGPHQAMTTKTEISPAPSTINNGENTTDKRIQDAQEGWTTVVSIREGKMQRRERAQEHQKNDSPKNAYKPKLSSSTAAAHSCVGRPEAPAPSAHAALGSPTPKMASASSQLNAAVTHNRFAALAMEDMELGADESNNTTAPSRTTEVLNNAGRTAVAVQGSDLNPRDTAGWKFTATKQVSQIQLQPQASKDTQNKSTSPFSESQAKKIVARVTKSSRLPVNLPKEEQKIIMRPRGGLCLARLEVDVVLSAVITAASVAKTEAMEDTICTNPTQNIIVVSTPDEERANKYATVRSLFIGGKNYETYAYRTAPHGTAKGRRWEKKNNERSTLSQADFPDLPPPSRGQWKQQQEKQGKRPGIQRGRSLSRKRDESRGRSASQGITTQEKMNFNQGRQPPARQLNLAQATALRQENEQLKRSLAELNARLNSFINAQNSQAPKQREHSSQQPKVQEAAPQPPAPNPPVPEEEKDNIEMEEQPCAENNTEPETGEADRSCGPAPKRRALEGARERRFNMRLDRLEERQDQREAKIDRLDQRVGALEQRVGALQQKVDTLERKVDALDRKVDVIIQALVAAGIIPQPPLNLTTHNG